MKPETKILFFNGESVELNSEDTELYMDQISEHLSQQPGLIAYYGDIKARCQEQVNDLKNTIEIFMASERTKLRAASKEKRTYKEELNDQIMATDAYIDLVQKLHSAEDKLETADVFFQAIKSKGMSLNSMAGIAKSEMFVNDKVMEYKGKEQRRKARIDRDID